ncbi:MAG TPA: NAD(P)/FAD-dependent oxidoreductase [Candidatus Binatia bacterium]|nr:NAD(P)/FAD-dependent oxidoreductase [Candidatus Binatia bacterium]
MQRTERVDALILGGGMAGLTAALTLQGFGLETLLVDEARSPGGQLHEIHAPITDHPFAFGSDGARYASLVLETARRAELSILVGAPVLRVSVRAKSVKRQDGTLRGRALLIATGLGRRSLGIPGEHELLGHGVSFSANRDRTVYAGKPVVVIGGGTGAVEDALLCSEVGCQVTLLHRSARFRARTDFLARARKDPGIRMITHAEPRRIVGQDNVEAVEYRTKGSRITRSLKTDGVFLRIGWEPRTELLRGQIPLDRGGYVRVGPGGATRVAGVFAAGDVCSPRCPTIANAAGQGAAAAWEMARLLGRVKS